MSVIFYNTDSLGNILGVILEERCDIDYDAGNDQDLAQIYRPLLRAVLPILRHSELARKEN